MSTLSQVSFPCPTCGSNVEGEVAVFINLGKRPDLRTAILDRHLNALLCESCENRTVIVRTMGVMDFKRYQWVTCYPDWAEIHWKDLANAASLSFHRNIGVAASGFVKQSLPKWTVRVVFGYEALREKLIIWDAGLQDHRVELAKLNLMAGRPEWAAAHITLAHADADLLGWHVAVPDQRPVAVESGRNILDQTPAVSFSPAELEVDPFVSFRRWLVEPQPADPFSFDLDGQNNAFEDGLGLRTSLKAPPF